MTAAPEILDVRETAALLRISVWKVYALAERGELHGAAKIGGQWRVSRSQLLAGYGLTPEAVGS